MEFVAIMSIMPMLQSKIMPFQYASIRGRGQLKGMQQIEKWIRRNKRCRYFVKLDIIQCFKSIKVDVIDKFLIRDLNKNRKLVECLIRLIRLYERYDKNLEELISDGLAIGTPISQWICNYVMSYVYRFIQSMTYTRRNKKYRKIEKQLFYMDDILLLASSRKHMLSAIKDIIRYLNDEIHLQVHDDWHILAVKKHPIDMMGYRIYYSHTEIRPRIFLRARKQYIRSEREIRKAPYLSLCRSKSITAYYGYFKHTNSETASKKYSIKYVTNKAKQTQSHYSKEMNTYGFT